MSNFVVDTGAENGEIVSTLNYLLSNLGNMPYGLSINRQTGEIYNIGTNTLTGYLYRYINIGWANNVQGLYFSGTAADQTFYGVENSDNPVYPVANSSFVWRTIYDGIAGHPTAIGPTNGVSLWYSVGGGRTINFVFSVSQPSVGYVQFIDGQAIDLDSITAVGNAAIIGNNSVIGDYLTVGQHWTLGAYGNIAAPVTIANLVTNSVLDADTVGTTQLQNYSVTNIKLGNNSVTTDKIQNYTIIDEDIANLTITGSKIVDYTLVGTKLANATVDTQQLTNSAVTSAKIADYTIVATDIANATITTQQVASYTLLGTNLANSTITSQQIQDYTIVGTDMANLTITNNQIANSTITSGKLSISALSDITANAGNITSGQITGTGQGGSTLITGYTTGTNTGLSNVALTNSSATTLTTYTLNNSQPSGTRLFISLTGTVNHWGNETTNGVYDSFSGNVVLDMLYSNSTSVFSSVNFSQGTVTMIRQSATSYDYRFYVAYANDQSRLLVNDTYTFKLTPNWFYRLNSTGNTVTPSTTTMTFQGRLAVFQANIS